MSNLRKLMEVKQNRAMQHIQGMIPSEAVKVLINLIKTKRLGDGELELFRQIICNEQLERRHSAIYRGGQIKPFPGIIPGINGTF